MIDQLPHDALYRVGTFLKPRQLGMLNRTCSALNDVYCDDVFWWENYCKHAEWAKSLLPKCGKQGGWMFEFRRRTRQMHIDHIDAHADAVYALDSKAQVILTGSTEQSKLWVLSSDTVPMSPVAVFNHDDDFVLSGKLLPNSQQQLQVVTTTQNGFVHLWDVNSGGTSKMHSWSFSQHSSATCSSWIAALNCVAVAGGDGNMALFDLRMHLQHAVWTSKAHEDTILCLHADNHSVFSGSRDKVFRVTDFRADSQQDSSYQYWVGRGVRSITTSGNKVIIGGGIRFKPVLSVWDRASNSQIQFKNHLLGHGDAIFSVVCDGKHTIISASWDGTIRLWDQETGNKIRVLNSGKNISSMINGENGRIVCGTVEGSIMIWSLDKLKNAAVRLQPKALESPEDVASRENAEILRRAMDMEINTMRWFRP